MKIIHYSGNTFLIEGKDVKIMVNPTKETLQRKRGVDIILHSFKKELVKDGFVIFGAGEYETKGVVIHGISEKLESQNGEYHTAYLLEIEGIKVGVLYAYDKKVTDNLLKELGEVDILLLSIAYDDAYKAIGSLDAKLTIPTGYKDEKSAELKSFLKSHGDKEVESLSSFIPKKSDLTEDKSEVLLLKHV